MATPIGTPSGAETKRAAFDAHRRSGGINRQQLRVMRALANCREGALTRQQLSARIPMPLTSVCGRVRELLDAGHLELGDQERRKEGPARSRVQLTNAGYDALDLMLEAQEGA